MAQQLDDKLDVFWNFYDFTQHDIVIIRHPLEKTIAIEHDKHSVVDTHGGIGQYAQWLVRPEDNGKVARFQNTKSLKYLRVHEGATIDADGKGDKECLFNLRKQSTGVFKLESKEYPGKFVGVDDKGIKLDEGGPRSRFTFWIRGHAKPFTHPYLFSMKNVAVIEHCEYKFLSVNDENDKDTRANGDRTERSQWEVEPSEQGTYVKLKNVKNGKYLRIHDKFLGDDVDTEGDGGPLCMFKVHTVDAPNHIKLESTKFPNKFIAVDGGKVRVGKGGPHSVFTCYRI